MLTAHHLPPEILTIEITETAQIENSRQARQTLAQLRRTGIRLSIDDYGTGQSNLEYLTEIEADERSEEHTSELPSLMRISYAVFCLKKQKPNAPTQTHNTNTFT